MSWVQTGIGATDDGPPRADPPGPAPADQVTATTSDGVDGAVPQFLVVVRSDSTVNGLVVGG